MKYMDVSLTTSVRTARDLSRVIAPTIALRYSTMNSWRRSARAGELPQMCPPIMMLFQ